MKKYFLITILFLFYSCGNVVSPEENSAPVDDISSVPVYVKITINFMRVYSDIYNGPQSQISSIYVHSVRFQIDQFIESISWGDSISVTIDSNDYVWAKTMAQYVAENNYTGITKTVLDSPGEYCLQGIYWSRSSPPQIDTTDCLSMFVVR